MMMKRGLVFETEKDENISKAIRGLHGYTQLVKVKKLKWIKWVFFNRNVIYLRNK